MGFDKEIKLGDTFQELPKSKFQVQHADNIGHFPFYTSGDSVLTHSEFNVDDEIIFLATGGKANVKFHSGKAAYSTDTYAIKGKDHSSKYLFYLLLNNLSFIDRNFFSGSGLKHLQKKDFRNWLLNFPNDTNEEERIVQFLTTLDRAIASTEQLIAKYQRIKTGLLHDLLTRGIDEHGNLRSEKTHLFKDSKLGRIPVEWEVVSLKQLMTKGRGFIQTGPFGSQLHSYEYVSEGIPVIMPQDIQELTISTENIARITEQKANSLSKHLVLDGDIIYARRGDISRCAVITTDQKGWFCGTGCILMRFEKENILNPNWFKLFYQSSKGQNQINANAVGLMMINLNSSVLNQLNIYQVPIDEQNSIVRISKNMESTIENFRINLTKLQSLKTGLMQDLLSGKVRVK